MKKVIFLFAATLFIAGTSFTGCKSPDEKVEDAEQNVAEAKAKLEKARADSADYANSKVEWAGQVAKNEKTLAEYRLIIAKEKDEQRIKDEARLAELQKRNDDMKVQIEAYREGENKNWTDFKNGVRILSADIDHDMNEFGQTIAKITNGDGK